jgi:NAD(P)-dependent dehydrogenase (short-subunit alcohol dehydrogenase family)
VDEFATLIGETESLYGLVYNAGGSYDTLAALVDQDRAEALFQLNFWAMTRLAGTAARPLMRAKSGRIIAIGSVTSQLAVSGNSIYAASKGAMLSYIRTLAVELARKGVTANYISPGYVDTALLEPYAAYREKLEQQIPLRRFAQPEEIGALTRFLFSPLAGYITGSVIPIDGGLTAGLLIQR